MTKTSTIRQILSDPEVGLLPYLRNQLQMPEFSKFETQFSFQAQESRSQLEQGERPELQTTLSMSLQFLIILHSQISPEEATLLALELQEMLEASLVHWSQHTPHLLLPIREIKGSFGSMSEVRYHGGHLPGFSLDLKFDLIYSTDAAEVKDTARSQAVSSSEQDANLYSPGSQTSQSGQNERNLL